MKQCRNSKCDCGSDKKYKNCCANNKQSIIYSNSSIDWHNAMMTKSVEDIVKEYINFPILPTNKEITISKICVYNWDPLTRRALDLIKYNVFTSINSIDFPIGFNEKTEYMPDEYVSPVIIIDKNNIKYKVDCLYWFPLIDVHDGIIIKQGIINKKVFPYTVFIDENVIDVKTQKPTNKWILSLLNLVGYDILMNLRDQE